MLTLSESRLVLTETGAADGEWAFPPLGGKVGLDGVLGVRISRDPIEERGGKNLYGFCYNDAVNKIDILGSFTNPFTDWQLFAEWLLGLNGDPKHPISNNRILDWSDFDTSGKSAGELVDEWKRINKKPLLDLAKSKGCGFHELDYVDQRAQLSLYSDHPWISGWRGFAQLDPLSPKVLSENDCSKCKVHFYVSLLLEATDVSRFYPGDQFLGGLAKDDWFLWLQNHSNLGHDFNLYATDHETAEWDEK